MLPRPKKAGPVYGLRTLPACCISSFATVAKSMSTTAQESICAPSPHFHSPANQAAKTVDHAHSTIADRLRFPPSSPTTQQRRLSLMWLPCLNLHCSRYLDSL